MIAGIETGGTKIFCAIAAPDDLANVVDSVRIETGEPTETLAQIRSFLERNHAKSPLEAIGVASFGPLETDRSAKNFGSISTTPKPGWANVDLHSITAGIASAQTGGSENGVPIDFVTDVSGSLLGEKAFGAAQGLTNVAYVTVGTGVGVGLMVEGNLVTGHGTPELGHILVRRHPRDTFAGRCPFHSDCLEGLACGPAISERWGGPAEGEAVEILAYYVAQLLVTISLSVAPQRIVVGGGVAKTAGLMDAVRAQYRDLVAGYLGDQDLESFIVPPALGDDAGVIGALVLARGLVEGN